MENGYSLSDLGAVMNKGECGNSWLWIIVLLLFLGGGQFGFGRNGELGQYATAASQQEILFGQRFDSLGAKINQIGDGISSLGYSQLQQMDANTASINGNIVNEGRSLQTQLCGTKYDLATAIHAEGEATRAMIQGNKIESLQAQVNQLQMQNAMAGVVKYPMQGAYYAPNPFCNCNC